MKISTLWCNDCDDTWVSHIVLSLCRFFAADHPESTVRLVVHSFPNALKGEAILRQPVPTALHGLLYRLDRNGKLVRRLHAKRFRKELPGTDVAFFWPDGGLDLYEQARRSGARIAHEMINTTLASARRIFEEESEAIGAEIRHSITDEAIAREQERLEMADLVCAPSPEVARSVLEAGIPEERIHRTSYGWSPERIRVGERRYEEKDELTVVFVGSLILRKGVHHVLRAWREAGIRGRLVFCGGVSDEVRKHCGGDLEQPGVECLGHVKDVSSVLDRADAFVLPSLEEGSPLVTYEAMAKGLPCIVSPMGGGGVMRHDEDGWILPANDTEAWADALRKLADDVGLREKFGRSAAARAQDFTWQKVAGRRFERMQALTELVSH